MIYIGIALMTPLILLMICAILNYVYKIGQLMEFLCAIVLAASFVTGIYIVLRSIIK